MRPKRVACIPAFLSAALLAACVGGDPPDSLPAASDACDEPAVRDVVERFGRALQQVSLLAPDTQREGRMRAHYGPLVTSALLDQWLREPAAAPGRETSSPWPARIEIDSIAPGAGGACAVYAGVAYATSADPDGDAALRAPVTLQVLRNGEWRIAEYREGEANAATADGPRAGEPADEPRGVEDGATDPAAAAAVVQRYYNAIAARDYADAYGLWSGAGAASGQSREEFAAGFAETESVEVEVGTSSRPEGAAGSVYVEVPVLVRARTFDGRTQRFEGTYTLRRSTVDGASVAQRAWRIHAARLRSIPPDSVSRGMEG